MVMLQEPVREAALAPATPAAPPKSVTTGCPACDGKPLRHAYGCLAAPPPHGMPKAQYADYGPGDTHRNRINAPDGICGADYVAPVR